MRITRQIKMPHMPDKLCFMQHKYLSSTNRQLVSDWRHLWMWGVAAPDS